MEEKTVKLNIDVEESIAGLKQLKKELKNTAAGSQEFKDLYGQIDDLEDKIKSAKKVSSDWIDTLEQSDGVLGIVGKNLNALKVSTQSFGGALKATGIGLIVGLLGLMAGAFSENGNAMKKIEPILFSIGRMFNGIFAAIEPLLNVFLDLAMKALPYVTDAIGEVFAYVTAYVQSLGSFAKAIYKLFTGDFKGAWADAKASVTDFSKHHDEAVANYKKGTKQMGEAEQDAADKAKALREKQEAERKAAEEKRKNEAEKAAAERLAKRKKELEEINSASDEINDALDKSDRKRREDKAAADDKDRKDFLQRSLDTANANLAIQKKAAEDEKLVEQAKFDIRQKGLDNLSAGIDVLKSVTGKSKELQKALLIAESAVGIAKIITNTQAANAAVTLKYALLPGGEALAAAAIVQNNVSAGIGIAATIAATAKGLSALGGGGAPSAGAVPSSKGGGGAPQFNVIGANNVNQLAQSIGNKENMPIKAYVVGKEVTTQQNLDMNIVKTATMGG